MKLKQLCTGTLTFMLWAIGLQGVAFVYDLIDGSLTSPVWDPHYNWGPFLGVAAAVSLAGAGFRLYLAAHRPKLYRASDHSYGTAPSTSATRRSSLSPAN